MTKISKNRKLALSKYDATKSYSLAEAAKIVKEITNTKFDSSVEISVRLGVDPRKANQMVRGSVSLPHGSGKTMRVLAIVTPDKEAEAKAAGADFVGLDEYLGRVLGPRGLMPNPKTGTVTMDIGKAVADSKGGKIDFKVDKAGIVQALVAKASFDSNKIAENATELLQTIMKLKPSSAKGQYVRSIYLSSTMSPSIEIDSKFLGQ